MEAYFHTREHDFGWVSVRYQIEVDANFLGFIIYFVDDTFSQRFITG